MILCIISSTAESYAQQYPRFNIDVSRGLPSNTVYNTFQDRDGFVWVGTENGLARYDGANFRIIPSKGLRSTAISNVQQDREGTIWCINFSGQVLHLKKDTLQPLQQWDNLGFTGFPVLFIDNDGSSIYISQIKTSEGNKHLYIYRYDIPNDRLTLLEKVINTMQIVGDQELWVSKSPYSITRIVPYDSSHLLTIHSNHVLKREFTLPYQKSISGEKNDKRILVNVRKVLEIDEQGNLTDLTDLFNGGESNFRSITSAYPDSYFIYGSDGVVLLDNKYRTKHFLKGENISSIIKLNEGGWLASTLNNGLLLIPSRTTQVVASQTDYGFNKLTYDSINKRIIAGDLGGNVQFFMRNGKYINTFFAGASISSVQMLLVDYGSNVLLLQSDRLYTLNLTKLTQVQSKYGPSIKQIIKTDSSYITASNLGLQEWSGTNTTPKKFLPNLRTTGLLPISDEELILGSQKGVLVFNLKEKRLVTSKYPFKDHITNLTSAIRHGNHFILGSAAQGVFVYDEAFNLTQRITTENGLRSNLINALDANDEYLAIATNSGVSLVDLNNWSIQNIDQSLGLQAKEVADLKLFDDQLVVAHTGLQFFDLPLQLSTTLPKIKIGEISSDGDQIYPLNGAYEIPYSSKELMIRFDVGNSIQSQGEVEIMYRLKELNPSGWNRMTISSSKARYLSVPSDKYTLEAYALNSQGKQSEKLIASIVVTTPFWREIWFQVLIYISGALLVAIMVYLYQRKKNLKIQANLILENKAQQLQIARLTSIRARMNPHFIFNTLTLIKGLIVRGRSHDAGESVQDFSRIMRGVLELSSKEFCSLAEEKELIEKYLQIEKRRFKDDFVYSIQIDEKLPLNDELQIPSLITQPYVENALRHGLMHKKGVKKLDIRFLLDQDDLIIWIEDNGIGRQAAASMLKNKKHQPFAAEAYQERIDLINQSKKEKILLSIEDLQNTNGKPMGTRIELKIPLLYDQQPARYV